MSFIMTKKFLTLISMTILFLSMSPIFAMDEEICEQSAGFFTILPAFDFEQGDQSALNKWVANNGAEIYRHLNTHPNFGYPEKTQNPHYYTRSEYWNTSHIYGGNQVDFVKKKDIPASTAIKSLLESEGRFDCRIAQRIVFLECMRRLMGDIAFDECNKHFEAELSQCMFAEKGETRKLHLCGGISLNPYFRLTSQEKISLYRNGTIGCFGYIPNIKEYRWLHPYGLLRGDHGLLCSDPGENEKLYVGFGSFYKDGDLSWDNVVKRFKNETFTLSLSEKVVIDEDKRTDPRYSKYIKLREEFDASQLQEKKDFIVRKRDEYEQEFETLQKTFWEDSASYFINFESVDRRLRYLNSPNIIEST